MIKRGLAAAFDLRLLLTMLGIMYAALAAACTFGAATSGGGGAKSLPGVGG